MLPKKLPNRLPQGRILAASVLICALASFAVVASALVEAQEGQESVAEKRARLQAELDLIEKQIGTQQTLLGSKQKERVSLERDIDILDTKIDTALLSIKARNIAIEDLSSEIGQRESAIGTLNEKLEREKESLAQILRRTDEIDSYSMVEIILSNKSLADFFEDLDDFQAVKIALHESFDVIDDVRDDVSAEKLALEAQRGDEVELRALQELEKRKVEDQEKEKQRILNVTKGQEAEYQRIIETNQKTAAEIRAQLFSLRDTSAIKFGDAIEMAKYASAKTGVRPALILAVLTQETKLGEFLGSGNWQSDMHPTRDRPLFVEITKGLGLDPNSVPVSKAPGYGWGGAMGPAQFIPSTWACYGGWMNTKTGDCNNSQRSLDWDTFWAGPWQYNQGIDRIRTLTAGSGPSNPWNNQHAFMATAVLMLDNGATQGGTQAERTAALRYFAGWGNASNPSYAFYGDSVMEHAANYQKQIDILEGRG